MKTLTRTFSFFLLFAFLTSFAPEPTTLTKGRIEVIFNRKTELNDLAKIKLDLAKKGIVLDYRKIEFDKYGDLISLYFTVDCKDGFSGSAESASLTNQSKFGFYRDYSKGVVSPFGVGNLE